MSNVTFKTIVYKIFNDPKEQLKSKNRQENLDILVETCKNNGLTSNDMSVREFVRLTMNDLRNTPDNNKWIEQIKLDFDKAVELSFAPDIKVAKSKEEREYDTMLKQKAITEQGKYYRNRRTKRLAGTLSKTIFDSPEFQEAEQKALMMEAGIKRQVKRHMKKYDSKSGQREE